MVSRAAIDEFLAQKCLALVGVSRTGRGFGNLARKELAARGYALRLVHPDADAIDGQPCARRLQDVAAEVGGVVLVTPPEQSAKLVREADEAGIRRVWLQQGAGNDDAVQYCKAHGITVVHDECVLMFLGDMGFVHRAHRWLRAAVGHMPE